MCLENILVKTMILSEARLPQFSEVVMWRDRLQAWAHSHPVIESDMAQLLDDVREFEKGGAMALSTERRLFAYTAVEPP